MTEVTLASILFTSVYSEIAAAAAKLHQSCPTLCDPIDGSPPGGFPVPGIVQARTLEWAAISFSIAWKWKVKVKSLSCVRLIACPWTAAHQAPPSMGFSRQEYWSGLPLPSPVRTLTFPFCDRKHLKEYEERRDMHCFTFWKKSSSCCVYKWKQKGYFNDPGITEGN